MLGTLMVVEGESAQGCSLMFRTRPWNAAGILTLSFAAPSPVLQFGVARNIIGSLSPGFAVGLFKMSSSLGTFPVNTTSLVGFSEGLLPLKGSRLIQPSSLATVDDLS